VSTVRSEDGTSIAFDRAGSGPPVILVGGGLTDRTESAPLATELAAQFTAFNYDRRGRGLSGDTLPYALEREIEDIEALIAEAGGSAHLYGVSSGGALALEAAAAGLPIERLAVYDVPYCTAGDMPQRWREYREQLPAVLADDRPGDAIALFMRLVGTPDEAVAEMRTAPFWPGLEAFGHSLAYEAACLGDGRPPIERLQRIDSPTLVITGGARADDPGPSGLPRDFYDDPAETVAASIPRAERLTLEGQGHVADPEALAPVLGRFFTS
jgi:pimeloyl-ACP methyl ester carboxylesterase